MENSKQGLVINRKQGNTARLREGKYTPSVGVFRQDAESAHSSEKTSVPTPWDVTVESAKGCSCWGGRGEPEKVRKVCGEGDPTDEPGKIKMDLLGGRKHVEGHVQRV